MAKKPSAPQTEKKVEEAIVVLLEGGAEKKLEKLLAKLEPAQLRDLVVLFAGKYKKREADVQGYAALHARWTDSASKLDDENARLLEQYNKSQEMLTAMSQLVDTLMTSREATHRILINLDSMNKAEAAVQAAFLKVTEVAQGKVGAKPGLDERVKPTVF